MCRWSRWLWRRCWSGFYTTHHRPESHRRWNARRGCLVSAVVQLAEIVWSWVWCLRVCANKQKVTGKCPIVVMENPEFLWLACYSSSAKNSRARVHICWTRWRKTNNQDLMFSPRSLSSRCLGINFYWVSCLRINIREITFAENSLLFIAPRYPTATYNHGIQSPLLSDNSNSRFCDNTP